MLAICKARGTAVTLVQHDLQSVPYPYPMASFDHVISLAVLNFCPDLAPVIAEVARLLKPQGIFSFTVEGQKPGQR